MSEKIWSDDAWEDYLYWQTQDKKTIKRINQLIKDIERNGCMEGIGMPEPLKGDLNSCSKHHLHQFCCRIFSERIKIICFYVHSLTPQTLPNSLSQIVQIIYSTIKKSPYSPTSRFDFCHNSLSPYSSISQSIWE